VPGVRLGRRPAGSGSGSNKEQQAPLHAASSRTGGVCGLIDQVEPPPISLHDIRGNLRTTQRLDSHETLFPLPQPPLHPTSRPQGARLSHLRPTPWILLAPCLQPTARPAIPTALKATREWPAPRAAVAHGCSAVFASVVVAARVSAWCEVEQQLACFVLVGSQPMQAATDSTVVGDLINSQQPPQNLTLLNTPSTTACSALHTRVHHSAEYVQRLGLLVLAARK
jgi:hypothetical protein